MTATTLTTAPSTVRSDTRRAGMWRAGAVAGGAAAALNAIIASAARAGDISLAIKGEPIPLVGFAQLTIAATIIGVLLAKVFSRLARHPRRMFTTTTIALTVVSFIPDVAAETSLGTMLVLMLTHVVAAAIVIPALASRLHS